MSDSRQFEAQDHAKTYMESRPPPPKDLLEKIIDFVGPNKNLALDIGCGSGQATFMISPHFQKVIGMDISPEQLKWAEKIKDSKVLHTNYKDDFRLK